jgi:transcription elongation GreA/GreB family factor
MKDVRKELHALCAHELKSKINSVNEAIALQKESSSGDTKSSAGDKFETGTAMTHLELEKLGNQLNNLETSLRKLNAFERITPSSTVKAGSLIKTERNFFWISIGIGEVTLENIKYYVISPISPVAQHLLGKKAGYAFVFNKQQDRIIQIL